jgi:hypothetical protein
MYIIQTEFATNLIKADRSYPDTSQLLANSKESARKYFDFKWCTEDILYKVFYTQYM